MRRWILGLCLLVLSGCSQTAPNSVSETPLPQTSTMEISAQAAKHTLEIDVPPTWERRPAGQGPFDLQVLSAKKDMNTGVFLYDRSEFDEGATLEHMMNLQVEDLAGKRREWKVVEPTNTYSANGINVATCVYSGVKDGGSTNYYKFSAIEFPEHPETVATTLQVAFPDKWDKAKPVLEGLVNSLRIKSGEISPTPQAESTP